MGLTFLKKKTVLGLATSGLVVIGSLLSTALPTFAAQNSDVKTTVPYNVLNKKNDVKTTTPIKHVVVIFQENVSFDHYFGTYPYSLNIKGEPQFTAKPNTPAVNNLLTPKDYNGTQPGIEKTNLTTANPNGVNPARLDRSQAMTPDMDHEYHDEMNAADGGKMDKFVSGTGGGNNIVMDYYDGNTVTGLWNYAQNFAMSDNFFGTTYGPSTPGALNLISGELHGATLYSKNVTQNGQAVPGDVYNLFEGKTVTGDADPYFDKASGGQTLAMDNTNKNVGDLLNSKGITWGWFEGGFADPTHKTPNITGAQQTDYSPHHEPFQYYQSTANPNHVAPSSSVMIGKTDQANHQYDINDFWTAVDNGNMPSVSYLKAPRAQDGHAGYSDPLDEQKFIVDTINKLQKTPEWKDTAVIVSYDDSDGWYDHVYGPSNGYSVVSGKAGYGPRLPLMVISPYAKSNFVDHTLTDQSSILKFIEDNWYLGRIGGASLDAKAGSLNNMFDFSHGPRNPKLFLDPTTGEPANAKNE
jgi:phospholipase C